MCFIQKKSDRRNILNMYGDTKNEYISNEVSWVREGGVNSDLQEFWVIQKFKGWNSYVSWKLSVYATQMYMAQKMMY